MEEPEKENIKLPFLQGCRIQLFNQKSVQMVSMTV